MAVCRVAGITGITGIAEWEGGEWQSIDDGWRIVLMRTAVGYSGGTNSGVDGPRRLD